MFANVHALPRTNQIESLVTMIRDTRTKRSDFIFYADRLIRLIVEEGLNQLPVTESVVTTPTNQEVRGTSFQGKICGVSILRAGEAMESGLRECCRAIRLGKILIQRDEATALPKLIFSKLPADIAQRYCLLLDPMLAIKAVQVLVDSGVPVDHIIFLNLLSCPEGLKAMHDAYPQLKIVTGYIDKGLDENKYVVPGLGDFGDRYFTDD